MNYPAKLKSNKTKKVSPSNLELSSAQLTKGTLFCGRLLVQHGVPLNLENELELRFTGWVDIINLINFVLRYAKFLNLTQVFCYNM